MQRKGYTPPTQVYIVGIAILTAVFALGGGAIASAISENVDDAMGRMDGQRVGNTVVMLASEGSATMRLNLNNDYDTIQLVDATIRMEGPSVDEPVEVALPERFLYTEGSISGESVCVEKQALRFAISTPPCNADAVTCTQDTEMDGDAPGPYTVETASGESTCVYYQDEEDARMVSGYACVNGVFNRKGFYEEYYTACDERTGPFVAVNAVTCPDTADAGSQWGCMVAFTYRCSTGEVTASLDPGGTDMEYDCTGAVEHARYYDTLSFPDRGSTTITVTGTVTLPSGEDDSDTAEVAVE